jgi:hypothetical protein
MKFRIFNKLSGDFIDSDGFIISYANASVIDDPYGDEFGRFTGCNGYEDLVVDLHIGINKHGQDVFSKDIIELGGYRFVAGSCCDKLLIYNAKVVGNILEDEF